MMAVFHSLNLIWFVFQKRFDGFCQNFNQLRFIAFIDIGNTKVDNPARFNAIGLNDECFHVFLHHKD